MDEITERYTPFVEGELRTPSWFTVFSPRWSPRPDADGVLEALRRAGCEAPRVVSRAEPWKVEFADGAIEPAPRPDLSALHFAPGGIGDETRRAIEACTDSLRFSTTFRGSVLEDFHAALKLMSAVAPGAVAVFDHASCRAHSGEWLHGSARSRVPPPPMTLFTVHAVRGDSLWLHTHGLLRCGSIELEMLDLPARGDPHELMTLLNTAAAMFIDHGVPTAGYEFAVGRDLDLMWEPWETAIDRFDAGLIGGAADRDDAHTQPSGVLFAPKRRRLGVFSGTAPRSPEIYREILADDPLLYCSNMESRRMSLLAVERFPVFRDLENRFRDRPDWGFAAKFGYNVDGDPERTEHLWFAVHAVDRGQVDATLLNEPYGIARMAEGDRGWHPLDGLSDWTIYAPAGAFRPDNVAELLALLED